MEPAAVAVQAIKEGEVLFGDTVAIFGAAPIGLLTTMAAKAVGATCAINSSESNAINKYTDNGVDVAFEIAGVAPTFNSAIDVTKARGTVVIVSIFGHPIEWNPMQLTNTGVKLTSTIAYTPTTFQQTINLINEGNLKVKDVITDEIELNNIVKSGFEQLVHDKSQAKILVKI